MIPFQFCTADALDYCPGCAGSSGISQSRKGNLRDCCLSSGIPRSPSEVGQALQVLKKQAVGH